ncbi:MAG: hypothetical protein JW869_07085 [Candidatus Omnitrophica bacterium]|nr:hypothetical protein [Candidatus Omnitrophota bacterium]
MMKTWLKENKVEAAIIALLLLSIVLIGTFYALAGHWLIKAMYGQKAPEILNRVFRNPSEPHSLEYYLQKVDEIFFFYANQFYDLVASFGIVFLIGIVGFGLCKKINNKASYIFFYLVVFVFSFPAIAGPIKSGLDDSWRYALNYFFSHNIQFGKDVVFTYGPLGFLWHLRPVGNNLFWGMLFYVITHALLVATVTYLIFYLHREMHISTMSFYLSLTVVTIYYLWTIWLLLIVLLLITYDQSRKSIFLICLCIYSFVFLLMKPQLGIFATIFLVPYLTLALIRERKYKTFLLSVTTIAFGYLSGWFLMYHDFKGLGRYLFSTWELIEGYSSAMALHPGHNLSLYFFVCLISVGLFSVFYLKEKKVYYVSTIFLLPALLQFKYSFTRQGYGHLAFFFNFVIIYIFIILLQPIAPKKKIRFCFFWYIILSFFFALSVMDVHTISGMLKRASLPAQKKTLEGYKNLYHAVNLRYYGEKLKDLSQSNLADEKLPQKMLGLIDGHTVDIYPWNLTYVAANDLNWRPRPVFQSYFAYTPKLDEYNYNFFTSEDAPLYIIWVSERAKGPIGSIDKRYLLNDEPKTILQIFDSYEPVFSDKRTVLFKRKKAKTFKKPATLDTKSCRWGQWIEVPDFEHSVIRAKTGFKRTLKAKVKKFIWKEKEALIEYKLKNGRIIKHRLVSENVISGIWAHPYVKEVPGTLNDGSNNFFNGETVEEIRLSCKGKDVFEPSFDLVWEIYKIGR